MKLIIEFIEVTFIKVIDLWKWLFNILKQYEAQRKSWRYTKVYEIQKEVLFLLAWLFTMICWINRRFYTCLEHFLFRKIHGNFMCNFMKLNLWSYNLVDKQLEYTYWPISDKVKATRYDHLIENNKREMFSIKIMQEMNQED